METKYRGTTKLTYELLHQILQLPDGVRIRAIGQNPDRDVAKIVFESKEEIKGVTFPTSPGSHPRYIEPLLINYTRDDERCIKVDWTSQGL